MERVFFFLTQHMEVYVLISIEIKVLTTYNLDY